MNPTDDQMCEAVVSGLARDVRFFAYRDEPWVGEADFMHGSVCFYTATGGSCGNPNNVTISDVQRNLGRGVWIEVECPWWK